MEDVFILSDYSEFLKEIISQIKLSTNQVISVPTAYDNEHQWHDWVNHIFKENRIKKLIIPISLPTDTTNNLGLIIAMHIRLNYEILTEERIVPIIFLSDLELSNILKINELDSDYNSQNIFFTKGVLLSNYDCNNIANSIKNIELITVSDYKSQVLRKLNVLQKDHEGKHSIANAWGCYKLAQVTGLGTVVFNETDIANKLKTLYAKYLICYNEVYDTLKDNDSNPIKSSGKRILFIDDRADDGWAIIMKNIFRNSGDNFVCVESSKYKNNETKVFHDFDGFYKESQSHVGDNWDLIIIDLRLHPEKEDIDNDQLLPTDFSGYKLINEFLNENEGYQIIVSTASNKIWNINAALNRGVASYYIKESPEFNYSLKDTKKHYDNFKDEVSKCFEKHYLKDIWDDTKKCKKHLDELKRNKILDKDFIGAISTFLDLAFASINNQNKNYPYDSSFMYYFLILEALAKQFFDEEKFTKVKKVAINGKSIDGFKFKYRKGNKLLKDFEGNPFLLVNPGDDLITTKRGIPYNAKFHNLIDFANVPHINPINLVELRNNFNHPDLINNRMVANIKKENVIEIFHVVNSLLTSLN